MDYVRLGNTGLRVSRICLGMMSYGDPAVRAWALPEDEAEPFVRRGSAFDQLREAMTHVDESTRSVAEELLHDVLAAIADARAASADPEPPVEDAAEPDADESRRKP